MIYNLNSGESQDANSRAMSECANIPPPYLPDFVMIPFPCNVSFHSFIENVNALVPASLLNVSNSLRLKSGL